jgi:ABC-type ATPase involved in cell division
MYVVQLQDYSVPPRGSGEGLNDISFTLATGDVCAIESPNSDDAQLFLRALATLALPSKGTYVFNGQPHDLRRYGDMLCCKQLIGYVARDAALISNLTVRQNLLLQRYYHENRLDIDLEPDVLRLCQSFGLMEKLDQRPSLLNTMEIQAAIVIREWTKKAHVMLLSQPEDFIGHAKFDLLVALFEQMIAQGLPTVFLSFDQRLVARFANRKIVIDKGSLTMKVPGTISAGSP